MRQIAGTIVLSLLPGCRDLGPESGPTAILRGQAYLISKPGPIPAGWIPPPLEQANTIIVLDTAGGYFH